MATSQQHRKKSINFYERPLPIRRKHSTVKSTKTKRYEYKSEHLHWTKRNLYMSSGSQCELHTRLEVVLTWRR